MNWYRFVYRTFYRLGLTPWDKGIPATGLVELIEGPNRLAPGRALDLGCGTGTNSLYLAEHGWTVTGVDMVPQALDKARLRATQEKVIVRFLEGDVTRLAEMPLDGPFNLLVDVGCFHTLPADLRESYVKSVSAIVAPGATLFLFGFAPRRMAPIAVGVTQDEIKKRFSGWELVSGGALQPQALRKQIGGGELGAAVRYFSPGEYRLQWAR